LKVLGDQSEPLLEELARKGAEAKVQDAIEAEVETHLGRQRYEHKSGGQPAGYRNGHAPRRTLATRCGPVTVCPVKLRATRKPFASKILIKYQRQTDTVTSLLPDLYLVGLATGDFEGVLQEFLGEGASLSPATIVRLKAKWEDEYRMWCRRPLRTSYAYVWADGIYLRVGGNQDRLAILVVMGVNAEGVKEVLAIEPGWREDNANWRSVFRGLHDRGLKHIRLVIGDGIRSLWNAVEEVYPAAARQRCWRHKLENVLSKLPKRLQSQALEDLQTIYQAANREEAIGGFARFAGKYHDYEPAVELLLKDQDTLLSYFAFPKAHWVSLKTTNPLESVFAPIRVRLNKAKRIRSLYAALALTHQLLMQRETRLNRILAPDLAAYVAAGKRWPTETLGRRRLRRKSA
jgi:transposase-like protein